MNATLDYRAGLRGVVAGFGRMGRACAVLLVLGAGASALADGVEEYKFCNKHANKETATDLHIEFDKNVKWEGNAPEQDPEDAFTLSKGKPGKDVDLRKGENGKGVAPGECVTITFQFEGNDTPKVKKARWTKADTLDPKNEDWLGDAMKQSEIKHQWISAPATGDGVLLVSIADQEPVKFAPTPGDTGEATAAKFAEFVAGLPFGEVLCVEGLEVVCTARVFGTVEPGIAVEVLQQDSTQTVEVTVLPVFATGFEPPLYKGAPEGVPVEFSDADWYPMEEFALSARVHTYLPNEPGFSPLPGGNEQFLVAACGQDGPAGAQRDAAFSGYHPDGLDCLPSEEISMSYDTTSRFVGLVPPDGLAEFMGGFALAPAEKSRYFVQMNTWADIKGGTAWSAGYQVAPEPPGSPVDPTVVQYAGPQWQNIPADAWVTLETVVSFAENRIVRVAITDLQTGERTEVQPEGWFLDGGSGPDKPFASAVRLFSEGIPGNHTGWDNFDMDYQEPAGPCYADFTGDGELDLFDFLAYVNAFNNGEKIANCDEEGGLTLFDFLCFVNAFNEGCG